VVALDGNCPYTEYLAPMTTNSSGQALLKGVKQANFAVFCTRSPQQQVQLGGGVSGQRTAANGLQYKGVGASAATADVMAL